MVGEHDAYKMVFTQERVRRIRLLAISLLCFLIERIVTYSPRVVEYLILIVAVNNLAGGVLQSACGRLQNRL